jgi:hypothetical protein
MIKSDRTQISIVINNQTYELVNSNTKEHEQTNEQTKTQTREEVETGGEDVEYSGDSVAQVYLFVVHCHVTNVQQPGYVLSLFYRAA